MLNSNVTIADLSISARDLVKLPEELAVVGVELGAIVRDTAANGRSVTKINVGVLKTAGCDVDSDIVRAANGKLSRKLDQVTIQHDFYDYDGKHGAAAFIRKLLNETKNRRNS